MNYECIGELKQIEDKVDVSMNKVPLILNGNWYNYPYLYDVFSRAEDYEQKCIEIVKEYINDNDIKIINPIDVGSGTGKIYYQLLKYLKIQGKIFLVDNNLNMIDFLNQNIKSDNVKIIKSDIKNVGFIKSNFIISSFGFPSNISNKENTFNELKKIYELLLNDGILITIGWNEKWNDEFFALWKKYLNIDYCNKIKSIRNCNLSWYKNDISSVLRFSNIKERNYVLGNYFGNEFLKDNHNNKRLEWNVNMGITVNTKEEIKVILDNWK